jgi:cytochrome c
MSPWNQWLAAAVLAATTLCTSLAQAETMTDAKALQDAAIALIKSKGMDAAAQEINGGGAWRKGSLYVVVVKFDGTVLGHSANDKFAGKNVIDMKDATGRPFVRESIDAAKTKGQLQTDVRWANPVTKQLGDATVLAQRVPGQDAYLSTMVFK